MIATYPAEAKFCTYANHSFCPPGHGCIDNFWTTSMKAERLNFHGVYDTVVMMNVLEHCEDAVAILTNIYASLKHGGIFVFMDRFNFDDVSPGARGDAWRAAATGAPYGYTTVHPLTFTRSFYERHLNSTYQHVFHHHEVAFQQLAFVGRKTRESLGPV